jgi:nucleoside-diphosphate-sugar epimerase
LIVASGLIVCLGRQAWASAAARGEGGVEEPMGREAPETVLITGSSGFLGQAIARGLTGRYRVIGLDVVEPRSPLEGMDTYRIDLTSDHEVAAAMRKVRDATGGRVASVVHLAAYYDTTGEDNPKYDQVTVQGTRRLLDQLKWLDCGQFVFSSTMLVHKGGLRGVRIDETWPVEPPWAYPRSKAETERLIAAERGPIKSVVMRFAGVYDEDCRAAFIAQQIARIAERLPTAFLFTGDLENGQPYLHVADMVDAVVRAVDRRRELPDEATFLIGEEETPSYGEMQEHLAQLIHGETWPILTLPKGFTRFGA